MAKDSKYFKGDPTYYPPRVDESHSTTIPLAGSATFAGEFIERVHDSLLLTVDADQDSTSTIQMATDDAGSNILITRTIKFKANTPKSVRINLLTSHYRVQLTNDSGSAMTALNMHTCVGEFGSLAAARKNIDNALSLESGLSMGSDFNSTSWDASTINRGAIIAEWESIDASNSTMVIEGSHDDSTWNEIGDSGVTILSTDDDSQAWQFTSFEFQYYRVAYKANNVTAGTVDIVGVGGW